TAAVGVLRRELGAAQRGGLVLWRLRALNELGTVEAMRDARGDRLRRAYEVAVRIGALDTAASVLINLAGLYVMTDVIPEALAAAPWHTALLVLAVQGDATVSEVKAELARATAGARFPATWLGYAHAVTLAAAGDPRAAEAAFRKAERGASRYPLFRAIALRL